LRGLETPLARMTAFILQSLSRCHSGNGL
jgi:hypothetical protein